ncbi:hypothetical protein [Phycicoccus sp. 3266]|uniref:hypothetical protein n=1 Tax=Phycicoccus sp. 3266 TaxID=2817751 RepID=UPI00285DE706|nr:hypothetical protein [Phycicoccus sp. 3266]MDR6864136.1 hypothetical protein [Phycicoccus sp. 3266]
MHGNPLAPLRPAPLIALYALILHWTYQHKIAPIFGYLGSRYREPDTASYALAGLMVLLLSFALPRHMRRPSDFVLWMLYVMVAIPAILVPQYADIISKDRSLALAAVVTADFLLIAVLTRISPKVFRFRLLMRPSLLWAITVVISIGFYSYLSLTQGLHFSFAQDLSSVRDTRLDYRQQVAEQGALLGYLVRIQANAINPLFIIKGMYNRRWSLMAAGTVGQVLIYGLTGYKLTLLSVPALFAVAAMFRYSRQLSGSLVLWGVTASSILALAIDNVRGGAILFTELFIDRLLLVPGTLTAAHVLVFDGAPKMQWSYSFMSPFLSNPYGTTPAFLVGAQFSGDAQVTANANFFADGFANLGWSGMTIESLVLVLLLWIADGASRHLPLKVTAPLLLVPTIALVNGSVFTSILTGGLGLVIALCAALSGDGWERETRRSRRVGGPQELESEPVAVGATRAEPGAELSPRP